MPLNASQTSPTIDVTPPAASLASSASVNPSPLDVGGFKDRVVAAARTVPTGTFVLVIKTGMVTGDLTLRYTGSYDVTNPATPRCRLDGAQNGQPLTVTVIGDKLYTRAGTGKYTLSSVSSSVTRLGLVTVRPDLPTLVGLVSSSVRELTYIAPDAVNGVPVQHWQALVDASVFAPSATGTTAVELWLDSSDLLRQASYSLTTGDGSSSATTVTLTYGGFNGPVSIREPDPSEVR